MSEIERDLDELSGQLAGTGAAGRRALTEAEYHLRAVAAGAMTRDLPVRRPAGTQRHPRVTVSTRGWLVYRARNGHAKVESGCAPALLGGLAGDAEPGADLGHE